MSEMTPMLKQFLTIKNEYPDSILFFRMGDFYEMFFDDAKVASKILGITLTSRGTYQNEKVPMCGIPHHSANSYIGKLISQDMKVAICEQIEDPKMSKGIVKRDVIRVITPGSFLEEDQTNGGKNIYMAALSGEAGAYGLAHLDLSTGVFRVTEVESWSKAMEELGRIDPAELIFLEEDKLANGIGLGPYRLELIKKDVFHKDQAKNLLKEQLEVKSLEGFGCAHMDQGVVAAGAIIHYLKETQKGHPDHIKDLSSYILSDYMILDDTTVSNLELFSSLRRGTTKGSLSDILDKTVTPMGSRMLKRWMAYPLLDLDRIRRRLAAVSNFKEDRLLREEVREKLEGIYDLERLNGRISLRRANARDLVALKLSIGKLPDIKALLIESTSERLSELSETMDTLEDLAGLIDKSMADDPPLSLREGGLIREGYDPELDQLISIARDGKSWIADLVSSEQKRTGISKLKIGYNKVFGYYIEVTKANAHLVPPDYIRKQTLVNCERYITESLKEYEERVLGAEERRIELELRIFEETREKIAAENQRIKKTAQQVAEIDSLAALGESADHYAYSCPEVNDDGLIEITDGRHPVIEQTVREEAFVPNDIKLDNHQQQVLIITGPNMAGKSTILRQTALTVLMAQMGSYVPATKAVIGLVDRIFTRIGASDDISKGQSTFMVEMNETANILRHSTPKSLVILDEIGRGTSTYDGLSIAWAVAESLHDRQGKGVRTLFATHYHELTELMTSKPRVRNFNIAVKEWNDRIIFLRKLVSGGTSRSYGIQVARIAGIPEDVIRRAGEILENLEGEEIDEIGRPRLARSKQKDRPWKDDLWKDKLSESMQLNLFGIQQDDGVREKIKNLDISSLTPLQALIELDKLKKYVEEN